MAHEYQVKLGTLTPIAYLTVQESGVLLTGRYWSPPGFAGARRKKSGRQYSLVSAMTAR